MLLNKRIEIRRKEMTALVTINRGLKGTNEDGLFYTAIVPILVARR